MTALTNFSSPHPWLSKFPFLVCSFFTPKSSVRTGGNKRRANSWGSHDSSAAHWRDRALGCCRLPVVWQHRWLPGSAEFAAPSTRAIPQCCLGRRAIRFPGTLFLGRAFAGRLIVNAFRVSRWTRTSRCPRPRSFPERLFFPPLGSGVFLAMLWGYYTQFGEHVDASLTRYEKSRFSPARSFLPRWMGGCNSAIAGERAIECRRLRNFWNQPGSNPRDFFRS